MSLTFLIAHNGTRVQIVYGNLEKLPSVGDSFPRGVLRPEGPWTVTSVFGDADQCLMAGLFADFGEEMVMAALWRPV